MKNIFNTIVLLLITVASFAQAAQKMSYQAVVRDAGDALVTNSTIGARISILKGSDTGVAVYIETQSPTTNANGLMSTEVGSGTVVSGDLSTIDWSSDTYYIKSEIDLTGGTTYTITGVSQLLSVPYALFAFSSDGHNSLDEAYNEEDDVLPGFRDINADNGSVRIVATDNSGLEIDSDFDDAGLVVFGVGEGGAVDVVNVSLFDAGDAIDITNAGGGDAIDIDNTDDGDAIDIDNNGQGDAIFIDNSDVGFPIDIVQSGNGSDIFITDTGNGDVITAMHSGTLGNGINMSITNAANTDHGILLNYDGVGNAVDIDNSDNTGGEGLSLLNDGGGDGVYITNDGGGDGLSVNSDGGGEALYINNIGAGNGVRLENQGTGNAVDIVNDADGHAVTVENNSDLGMGIDLHHTNVANAANAVSIENDGLGQAVYIQNDSPAGLGFELVQTIPANTADVMLVDNFSKGTAVHVHNINPDPGHAIHVEHIGLLDAVLIENAGVERSIKVLQGNPANGQEAVNIENGGIGAGMIVSNGNPFSMAPGILVEAANIGVGIEVVTADPGNFESTIFASTVGLGSVATFFTEDNDANFEPTVFANNSGSGSAGVFIADDNPFSKVNFDPAIRAVHTGLGAGIDISITNAIAGGPDANTEPAIFAKHDGLGSGAYFDLSNSFNTSIGVDIINAGSGTSLHIDNLDGALTDSEPALHVEQSNISLTSDKGYAAHFESHNFATLAGATVLMNSAATDPLHSTLVVIPADPTKIAASFEGKVEIANDLTVIGHGTLGSATIATLDVPVSATIGDLTASTGSFTGLTSVTATIADLTVTTSFTAPAKSFKIDHPLDPENMFLVHNSIESNERLNIYSGNITTDEEGYATIELPIYMSALNADFRYQLTIMDQVFAQAIIWKELDSNSNTFVIKTDTPDIQVSWQVTGSRIDTWALENPLETEVDKVHIK